VKLRCQDDTGERVMGGIVMSQTIFLARAATSYRVASEAAIKLSNVQK
jgi:hypothetical protein